MTRLRQILCLVLAMMIASPACCCLAATATQESHGCCESQKEPDPKNKCDCKIEKQAFIEVSKPAPQVPALVAPVLLAPCAPDDVVSAIMPNLPTWVMVDTGPPRLKLAVYQCFLI